jgi:hypothetical protein
LAPGVGSRGRGRASATSRSGSTRSLEALHPDQDGRALAVDPRQEPFDHGRVERLVEARAIAQHLAGDQGQRELEREA